MRECNEYEITIEKLLNIVHRYTDRIKIHVVSDRKSMEDKVHEFYLTENLCKNQEETDRVLKYYAKVPVWNLHVGLDEELIQEERSLCRTVITSIVANCHYEDMREGFLAEREDKCKERQRERQRQYRQKLKGRKES